ncbi:alanine racemase [Streptomonospora sp. NEAU-YY374]|nr:alanine racemase [Streptomonospora nanhaiensis]MBX9389746.1 alanine racemase [Streptomonospora nanhaiensis]
MSSVSSIPADLTASSARPVRPPLSPDQIPDRLPAYVYDLPALAAHAAAVRTALAGVEVYYAVKANPDPHILRTLAPHVDGFETASVGEAAHVRATVPGAPVALAGPGKTAELDTPVHRLHLESLGELDRLLASGRRADVLLRLNLDLDIPGLAPNMCGPSVPFGMAPAEARECVGRLAAQDRVRFRGVHAHLASGLEAPAMLQVASAVLDHARALGAVEVNLGGGMGVSYSDPDHRFDWEAYGRGLARLRRPGEVLRVEPGRALAAYCGYYVTAVVDLKRVHGRLYAVVEGGTHHMRTPAARGHDQPLVMGGPGGPGEPGEPVTVVGRLCLPFDVLARGVPLRMEVGDTLVFRLAGAYAWNISYHDFLMHPRPAFHYLR